MKIKVAVEGYGYMGLYKDSEHEAVLYEKQQPPHEGDVVACFTHLGRNWVLDPDEYDVVVDSFPAPNEKLLDVINTDLKQDSVLDIQHGGSHYKDKKIQPIEYITANNLDFCEGNIVKYASRHKEKNGAEDIRKVIHYAQFILKFEYGEEI